MAEPRQGVRLNNEEPAAANVVYAVQFASLANLVCSKGAAPSAPQVFFILASNKPFEIDPPHHIARAHEIQSRERYFDGGCPPDFRDAGFRSPYTIPAGITVLRFACLLVGD